MDEPLESGYYVYVWDGRNSQGTQLSPGVYIAVMEAPGYGGKAKLVLTR